MQPKRTLGAVIACEHALHRWLEINHRIQEMRRSCAMVTLASERGRIAGCRQPAIPTYSRIPIGDEATTRRVRGRFMMEPALCQRAVRMERIGTFRFQLFDHHFDMFNAEL